MKISIGQPYLLPNTLHPHDRSLDYRVKVISIDRKTIPFETDPATGRAKGTPLSLPRTVFLKLATPLS